jgi:hypothetical protein
VQQGCLLWHDPQPKGCQSLVHFLTKSLGIFAVLEHRYKIIRETRELCVALAGPSEPSFEPEIQDIVQVDIRKYRARRTPLRYPVVRLGDSPFSITPALSHFVQEAEQSRVIDPMLDECPEPLPID